MRCLFEHHFLMNGNIENVDPSEWVSIFLKLDNIIRMPFKSKCGFGKRKCQNKFRPHGNVSCDSFDDAILIAEQKKRRGMYCQRKPVPARFILNLKIYFLKDLRPKIVRSVIREPSKKLVNTVLFLKYMWWTNECIQLKWNEILGSIKRKKWLHIDVLGLIS